MSFNDAVDAISNNDVDRLRAILDEGLSPNSIHPISGTTLLQAACDMDSIHAIKCLIEKNVNVGMRFTMISRIDGHVICDNGVAIMHCQSVESAQLLIAAGADHRASDNKNQNSVDWARAFNNLDLVSYYENI